MNPQLEANVENQDCAQSGEYKSCRMESFVCRAGEYVGDGTANNGPDDAEYNRPNQSHMDVHYRFGNDSCDQSNKNIPD